MGRFEIARNKEASAKGCETQQGPPVTRATDLMRTNGQEARKIPFRGYVSPAAYPLGDNGIAQEERGMPSRNVILQWPMGHRTILPFRSISLVVSDEGEIVLQVPPEESRRIQEDIAQAHRRLDDSMGTSHRGPH